jgi:hypothetical protein
MDREPDIIFPGDRSYYPTAIWIEENMVQVGYPESGVPKPLLKTMIYIDNVPLINMTAILRLIHTPAESDYMLKCQDAIHQYILKRDLDNALKGE